MSVEESFTKQSVSNADLIANLRRLIPVHGAEIVASGMKKSIHWVREMWTIAQHCPQEWIENPQLALSELFFLSKMTKRGINIIIDTTECCNILVNGKPYKVRGSSITFEAIVELAGGIVNTVTYRKALGGDAHRHGIMSRNQSVGDIEGMIFSAADIR